MLPQRVVVLGTVLVVLALSASALPAQADTLPTFRVSDTGATGPELNLGVTSNGNVFVGGWNHVAKSVDDGATWQAVSFSHLPAVSIAADRVLIVDHDTDRVFVSDTYLACTFLSWSDDYGGSWTSNLVACGGGATDHQKAAVGKRVTFTDPTGLLYENLVYVCANGLAATNCGVSLDGGLTFLPTNQHGVGCAFQGAPVSDAAGVLYEPTSQCGAQVRYSIDNGLRWTASTLGSRFPASSDTPDMAVTPDGALYFFYTTADWKPAFARSTNRGLSWQGPFVVDVPGLTSSVFPSIVAGDNGRIALSFYATTDDAAGWNHNPGAAPGSIRWNGYVAVVTDAAAAAPTASAVRVTDHPLQYGCLSKLGGCLGNIADYMDIDVGPDGRVYAVFTDGCLATCASSSQSTADHAIVAAQTGGPTLKA